MITAEGVSRRGRVTAIKKGVLPLLPKTTAQSWRRGLERFPLP